jgi:hypothetical protein
MVIKKSIDIEDAVREELSVYLTAYCRPLPADYPLPNILVSAIGGTSESDWHGTNQSDTFTVNLTSRGKNEAEALDCLRTAIGILQAAQGGVLARVRINSQYSWGEDGRRPDLASCGATLLITARPETITLNQEES